MGRDEKSIHPDHNKKASLETLKSKEIGENEAKLGEIAGGGCA